MPQSPVKILVADDDPEDLELLEEHLLSVEPTARLQTFSDGQSAYEYLRSQEDSDPPSLIVLDYNMPGLTGAQVLTFLKASHQYASTPKVVYSNSSTAKFIQECLNSGASEYIVKPDTMEDIHQVAKRLVALARKDQSAGR